MFIDSHSHLDMKPFDKDRQQVLERALEDGIDYLITIGIDIPSSLKALRLAHQYDFVFSTIGFHPHHASDMDSQALVELNRLVSEPKIVAWGEIGLDFFHHHSPSETQKRVFRQQLEMAMDVDLPVIIHDRDAHEEMLELLEKTGSIVRNCLLEFASFPCSPALIAVVGERVIVIVYTQIPYYLFFALIV